MNEFDRHFSHTFSRNWWVLGLQGLVAIIFGLLAFALPRMTLLVLVYLFGIYALTNGVLGLIHAFSVPKGYPHFGGLIFNGLVSIAAGLLTFAWPHITALTLVLIIAFWAIVSGIFEIVAAIRLRRTIPNEWALVLGGVLSIVLGIFIGLRPAVGALAVLWWIGGFAILFGVLLIALSFRLRREGPRADLAAAAP